MSNALTSYEYLQEGERDDIEGWEQFVHIDGQPKKQPDSTGVKQHDPVDSYNLMGNVKRIRGDLDGAMANFNKVIEVRPDYAASWNNRGVVKKTQGDHAGALADFNQAIELKPDSAEAHNNRGDVKRSVGDRDGAETDFNKAKQLKRDPEGEYLGLGDEKEGKGEYCKDKHVGERRV